MIGVLHGRLNFSGAKWQAGLLVKWRAHTLYSPRHRSDERWLDPNSPRKALGRVDDTIVTRQTVELLLKAIASDEKD
jgi:hypothetical protein